MAEVWNDDCAEAPPGGKGMARGDERPNGEVPETRNAVEVEREAGGGDS
jgi:hypothetical protein